MSVGYFGHRSAAERYARGRPYFHPLVVGKVREYLALREPVARALDVACGTGQSAAALREIAAEVVGADVSRGMLAQAPRAAGLRYVAASAERLPFRDAKFDLATVALAFHWFDRARFLAAAHRALRPNGWLVIYNNSFIGRMRENPAFERWARDTYAARYPSPARHDEPFTDADAARHGSRFAARERFTNEVSFAPDELADYLLTQSNVIAAVESGGERLADVAGWLAAALPLLFPAPRGTFLFGGTIWYLQKAPLAGG